MARVRSLRKLAPGETLPALPRENFNTIIDVRTLLDRKRFDQRGAVAPISQSTTIVLVKNSSGSNVERFGVLGIDAPIVLPSDNEPEFLTRVALSCVTPQEPSSGEPGHRGKFIVAAEPIANGEIGRGYVGGVCIVRLQINDSDHQFADVLDNTRTHLKTATTGSARILWKESGSGADLGVIRFGNGITDGVFPVRLTQTGGSAGTNQVSACTFTYTVKDFTNDSTLGTGVALTGNGNGWRGLNIVLTAATYGMAYYGVNGALTLIFADEKPAAEQDCE